MLLTPEQYQGEILCERCGDDGTGRFFAICAKSGYTHKESCEKYTYRGLCARCEKELEEDTE